LVARVWERVIDSAVADEVVVATDSDEVAVVIRERGGVAVMTRADHPSGTDRVAEVASHQDHATHGIVVNVQGDEPFLNPEGITGAVALVREGRFALATCATPADATILGNTDIVKVVCDDAGRALYFSRAPIPFLRDPADTGIRAPLVRQHVGLYVYHREALRQWVALPVHDLERVERLEQLRPLAAGMAMGVFPLDAPPMGGIDTEDDLIRANALWADLHAGRP
jgi:3-deoxy-manno-octulosonate cytidylyltransferase (CMP-KDO synthetase)